MDPVAFTLITFGMSLAFGFLGSLLGLGGGIFIVPALTLVLHLPIKSAIGASIISVIATSSGAAAVYVRDHITNIRTGMFLEMATTTGAISGAYLIGILKGQYLFILFALLMLYSAVMMFRKFNVELPEGVTAHPLAEKLGLKGSYYDNVLGRTVTYQSAGVYQGFGLMYIAGVFSALLGIGNGAFKVMAMDMAMRLPMKVSTATSNFMIGVTAAASAGVYLAKGDIDPVVAAPVALGVLTGASVGSRLLGRVRNTTIRKIFVPVLLFIAIEMFLKGIRG